MKKELAHRSTPTLVDVARLAGVGVGTASRAINQSGSVSDKAIARVNRAIEQLGYQRNEVARNLKIRRTGAVGIVIPDIGGPFMATCIRAVQGVLRAKKYISVLAFTDNIPETETEEVEYLLRRQVDGLLIVPAGGRTDHFQSLFLNGPPVVAFDQPLPGARSDEVLVKNRSGAQTAVEHLLSHGHKRIACIAVNSHLYSIKKRIEGYREAMKAAGLEGMVSTIEPDGKNAVDHVGEWLKQKKPPTAVFSVNEWTSIELLQALGQYNVRIPEQMAFVGFDDVQLGKLLQPSLTVVVQPAAELGARAASLLVQRMSEEAGLVPKRILLNTELVIRRSCGCS